ncbi:hypothetical protein NKG05_23220 [Oerskovia sp. M15]
MTSADASDYRIEHDTMGEVRVPAAALYRAQTQRAVENFPLSGTPLERSHIEALARVKKAAARANAELGCSTRTSPPPSWPPPTRSPRARTMPTSRSTSSRRAPARRRT